MNLSTRLNAIEKRVKNLEIQVKPIEQAIFHFRRDTNGVENYKLGVGEDAVWVDKQVLDEHLAQYNGDGVIIFVPECLEQIKED